MRKNVTLAGVSVVLLVSMLVACQGTIAYETYVNWNQGYTIDYPANWELHDGWEDHSLLSFTNDDPLEYIFVRIQREDYPLSLDEEAIVRYIDAFTDDLQILNSNPDYVSFTGTQWTLIGEYPYKKVYVNVYGRYYMINAPNRAFSLCVWCGTNIYNYAISEFPEGLQHMLDSFKLLE